jgi:hypothetical protein
MINLSKIQQIQSVIRTLSPEELTYFQQWWNDLGGEHWDRQITQDSLAGKLDFLIEEAQLEKTQGQLQPL